MPASPTTMLTPEQGYQIAVAFTSLSAGFGVVGVLLGACVGWILCARHFRKRFILRSRSAQAAEDRAWREEIDGWPEVPDA